MALKLYNTLSRKKEVFKPLKGKKVGLYTCGPTVYWFAHIGNLRTYIFEDILKRVLEYNDYEVKHIMNITDVGHLTSDADTGEDKVEASARRKKKTVWEITKLYTDAFKSDLKSLNIKEPNLWIKATDTIENQINLIKILKKKGFTYKISDGIYFDTSKLKVYGRLWPKRMKIKAGARIKMVAGKKQPTDFALWKLTPLGVQRQMEWNSPWGKGFPGWHTECVVMAKKILGIPFDIHCGGVDHILIHHTNEIAQAEAAFGKILANFWLHGEFLVLKEGRMGKSEKNIILLADLSKKNIHPLAYRYLCLTAHYRSPLSFNSNIIESAQNSLDNLDERIKEIEAAKKQRVKAKKEIKERFLNLINDDLNIPKALALMWQVIKDRKLSADEKYALLLDFDKVFGLKLGKRIRKKEKIPEEILKLVKEREKYRQKGQWKSADEMRGKIKEMGYWVEDTAEGPKIKKL